MNNELTPTELEPCFDCESFNISRRPYDDGEFECTCRDCGATWIEPDEFFGKEQA